MKSLLRLEHVSYFYGIDPVLKDVSFEVFLGESLGVIGPNGGGKTTLLKIIAGLLPNFSGVLRIDGLAPSKQGQVAYLSQLFKHNSFFPLTCEEYISQGELYQYERKISVSEALDFVELLPRKDALFRELSGGEKQRATLARSLIQSPLLFLFDEPTNGLDSTGRDRLLDLVKKVTREFKRSIIVVDHNINQLLKHCDKILCLNKSLHWHNKKEALTQDILEDVYSCEFEHELLHEQKKHFDHRKNPEHKM